MNDKLIGNVDKHIVTLEDLINKKTELMFKKTVEVYVESLGGVIVLKQIPFSTLVRILDEAVSAEGRSIVAIGEAVKMIIFNSCLLLQDTKLQEVYECAEPYDIVEKIFGADFMAIGEIGDSLLKLYNLDLDKIGDMLKN